MEKRRLPALGMAPQPAPRRGRWQWDQGSSTLGLLDITMVWENPPVFSKPPKLVKTDIKRINIPFFRS